MNAGEGKDSTPKTPTPDSQTTKLGIGSWELEVDSVGYGGLSSPALLPVQRHRLGHPCPRARLAPHVESHTR